MKEKLGSCLVRNDGQVRRRRVVANNDNRNNNNNSNEMRNTYRKYSSKITNGQISMIFFFQFGDVATFSLRGLLFGLTKLKLLKRISFYRDTTEYLICYFVYLIHMSVCGSTHVCVRAFMCWRVWCAGCISNYQIFFLCVQLMLWGKRLCPHTSIHMCNSRSRKGKVNVTISFKYNSVSGPTLLPPVFCQGMLDRWVYN